MNSDLRAAVAASVRELIDVVARLVATVESSARAASAKVRGTTDDGDRRTGDWRSRSVKAHWATLSPRQHAARVRKMLAARGLKPKPKRKGPPSPRALKIKAALQAHWDHLGAAERAARVKKMLAGRGLKPKAAKRA